MDLDSLRGFVLAAGEGSIARAAPQMYLSVSALSRRIQDLERELGVKLFDRTSRGITVSVSGARVLKHAQDVLDAADRLTAAVTGVAPVRTVRLGICPGVHAPLRTAVTASLRATSGSSVRCVPGQNTDLMRQLTLGRVDLALLHQEPASAQVESHLVRRDRTMLMFSGSLPQAQREHLTLGDFADVPFVTSTALNSGTPVYYARLRSLLAEAGVDETTDVPSPHWIRDIVSSGSGFAIFIGPSDMVAEAELGLVVRAVEGLELDLETHLAWAPERSTLDRTQFEAGLLAVDAVDRGPHLAAAG